MLLLGEVSQFTNSTMNNYSFVNTQTHPAKRNLVLTTYKNRQRKITMIDILPFLRLRFSTSILLHCSLRSLVACRKAILFSSSFVHISFHWTQKNHNETKMQSINHKKQKRKKESITTLQQELDDSGLDSTSSTISKCS